MDVRKDVTLTRRQVGEKYGFCVALEKLKEPMDQHFSYGIGYNENIFEIEVKAINKAVKNDGPYDAYEKKRVELVKSFAQKDEKGEAIQKEGNFVVDDVISFEKALTELQNQHPAYQARQDFLDEEVVLKLHIIKMRHVPKYLGIAFMRAIMCFVEYEEVEHECPNCKEKLIIEDGKLVKIENEKLPGNVKSLDEARESK